MPKNLPSWSTLKRHLADLDRACLIGLIQDLYQANKENQAFLHARFALGTDVLNPYKTTIDRWLWPDVFKNQNTSVTKAKKAIADYKKAVGAPQGMVKLCVFTASALPVFATIPPLWTRAILMHWCGCLSRH